MLVDVAPVLAMIRELCAGDDGAAGALHAGAGFDGLGGLGALAWEHVSAGGKRLRARLALSAVAALGGRVESATAWAAACELLHNASLIHDDLQDGDRLRRGRPALWVKHGAAQAINAGDLCITLGFAALARIPGSDALRWRLTEAVTRRTRAVAEGQSAEMRLLTSGAPSWDDYAACVEGKTSALFALPVEGAALLAGRSPGQATCLADACRPMGLLFQIQDDIRDLYADAGRDAPGSDIAQPGKATALVVEHLRLYPADRDWLLRILTSPRAATARADVEEVIRRFADGGALGAAWGRLDAIHRDLLGARVLAREPSLHALVHRLAGDVIASIAHTRPGRAP